MRSLPCGAPACTCGPCDPDPVHAADPSSGDPFEDLVTANRAFAETFKSNDLEATAAKGLAVLTCMDSRIDPLRMLGLAPGDAKILRNAGARVTDDVLRTLVLGRYLLGVRRVMVVAHTNCRMTAPSEDAVHEAVVAEGGPDTRSISFLTTPDQRAALALDVQRIASWPYLNARVDVGGFLYDLQTGRVERAAARDLHPGRRACG